MKPRLFSLLSIAALLFAFGVYLEHREPGFEMPTSAPLEPAGHSAWTAIVSRGAGMQIDAEELETLAANLLEDIENRLEDLARGMDRGSDWRVVYRDLQSDHPEDGAAVLQAYREEIDRARSFVSDLEIVPFPSRPIEVVEAANPAILDVFSMAFFMDGKLGVVIDSQDDREDMELGSHCLACIPPLVVHETYPGHHIAFASTGQKRLSGDEIDYYFHEGWALYGEVLMLEAGYYGTAEGEIGAWRNLLLRTLRASIDARLHRGEIDSHDAIALYRDRLMLSQRAAETEVRGHFRRPGIKPSYLIGLLQLLELRRRSRELPEPPALLDLHRRLLRTTGTWPEIARRELGIDIESLEIPTLPPVGASRESAAGAQIGS